MPDALSSTAPLSSQSQYDAFATGYSSSGTVPGGRRLLFWETINGSNHFRQGTLSSFTLSRAVPEPASLALMGIALAGVGFKRRKAI